MAETVNIAAMAEKLSSELLAEFFWGVTGPMNKNWACEKKEQHGLATGNGGESVVLTRTTEGRSSEPGQRA